MRSTVRDAQRGSAGSRRHDGLGERLRKRREEVGISLRELARRIGVSASLISQIENGRVHPSVSTLYDLVGELGASFDALLFGTDDGQAAAQPVRHTTREDLASVIHAFPPGASVQPAATRKTIHLNQGVRWERLTQHSAPGVEFLYVVYEPGAASGAEDEMQQHPGREWCYVISGTLSIVVGGEQHTLAAGDSITYESTIPHRLENDGDVAAEMIWFQLG